MGNHTFLKNWSWGLLLLGLPLWGQTDETTFREFRFDFSTPGARANAMGRAFVGLADEATAAYNNPAGLSVLAAPEFSIEYKHAESQFGNLLEREPFVIDGGDIPTGSESRLDKAAFASYSRPFSQFNLSIYHVNQLNYRRPRVNETTEFLHQSEGYTFTYRNQHHVRKITLDNFGISLSRRFKQFSLGAALGISQLDLDYLYEVSVFSDDIGLSDLVRSEARTTRRKPALVLGTLYHPNQKLKLGLVYKLQPKFTYNEQINNSAFNSIDFPDGVPREVTFKVPDSVQFGIGYQPDNKWTLLLDVDWVRYSQLTGENISLLSTYRLGNQLFQFEKSDYDTPDAVSVRLGAEYLWPIGKRIIALRVGGFSEPDHKTRFVGESDDPAFRDLYDIQSFIFNDGDQGDNRGFTSGVGFVFDNRFQIDAAFVSSNQSDDLVVSFLYRFN